VLQVNNARVSSDGHSVPFGLFFRFHFSPEFALPFYFLYSRFDVGLWNVPRKRVTEILCEVSPHNIPADSYGGGFDAIRPQGVRQPAFIKRQIVEARIFKTKPFSAWFGVPLVTTCKSRERVRDE
jgi:hypothetical protein